MRYLIAALCVAVVILFSIAAHAVTFQSYRTCFVDTTFAAGADADTITFIPYDLNRTFTATAWTLRLEGSDTSYVVIDFFALNADTTLGTLLTLDTKIEPKIAGRLDSLHVCLPAPHEALRFRAIFGTGMEVPSEFGTNAEAAARDTISIVERCFGCVVGNSYTVSTTQTDSLPGGTAKYHIPIVKAIIASDVDVYFNWACADGDTNTTPMLLIGGTSITLEPVDLYQIIFAKAASNAAVRTWKWPGQSERVQP